MFEVINDVYTRLKPTLPFQQNFIRNLLDLARFFSSPDRDFLQNRRFLYFTFIIYKYLPVTVFIFKFHLVFHCLHISLLLLAFFIGTFLLHLSSETTLKTTFQQKLAFSQHFLDQPQTSAI